MSFLGSDRTIFGRAWSAELEPRSCQCALGSWNANGFASSPCRLRFLMGFDIAYLAMMTRSSKLTEILPSEITCDSLVLKIDDILDVFSVHFNCSTPLHFRNPRYNMIPHPPTLWEGVSHFMKGTKSERPAERGKKHKRADKTWQALQAHLWIFDVYVYTYIYTYTSTAQECH